MQKQLADVQSELANRTIEGSSGGGAVKVTGKGDGSIIGIKIDPQVVAAGDVSMLEDLVLTAVKQTIERAREEQGRETSRITGGMNIPGLM
jgi:nucleoid-associated protein EbfC